MDARTRDMMDEVVRLCPGIPIHASQGSWSGAPASAGTHAGCGAIDLTRSTSAQFDTIVRAGRRVGFAAWKRTPSQGNWPLHVHMIAVQPGGRNDRGCLSSGAHNQVVAYYEGRNGLANNGPDDATRAYVGTTWETYGGDDMPITDADAEKIAWAVWSLKLQPENLAAHTIVRDGRVFARQARDYAESAPARTLNWVLNMGGGTKTAAWAVLKGTYENTVSILGKV